MCAIWAETENQTQMPHGGLSKIRRISKCGNGKRNLAELKTVGPESWKSHSEQLANQTESNKRKLKLRTLARKEL